MQTVFEALLRDDARKLRAWDPARDASLSSYVGLPAEREVVSLLRSRRRSPFSEDPTDEHVLLNLCDSAYLPEERAIGTEFFDKLSTRVEREQPKLPRCFRTMKGPLDCSS